jgi:hypothetical protein
MWLWVGEFNLSIYLSYYYHHYYRYCCYYIKISRKRESKIGTLPEGTEKNLTEERTTKQIKWWQITFIHQNRNLRPNMIITTRANSKFVPLYMYNALRYSNIVEGSLWNYWLPRDQIYGLLKIIYTTERATLRVTRGKPPHPTPIAWLIHGASTPHQGAHNNTHVSSAFHLKDTELCIYR